MGANEPVFAEDSTVTIENFFGDLHPEGQQASTAFPAASEGERIEPEKTMVDDSRLKQRGGAHAEESLPEERPATPVAAGPLPAPDISPTQRASSSSSRHYAKQFSASRSTRVALVLGNS